MAITVNLLDSNVDLTITTTAKTVAVSAAANRLLLVFVCLVNGTTGRTTTVTASGLTWTKVDEGLYDTNSNSLSIHSAVTGGGGFSGNIVITQNNSIQQMHWAILEISGHDTTTPVPQTSGIDVRVNSSFPATLPNAAAGTGSRSFIVAAHNAFETTTAGASTTMVSGTSNPGSSPNQSFGVGWSNSAFAATLTLVKTTSTAGAALSCEVAAAATGSTVGGVADSAVTLTSTADGTRVVLGQAVSTISATSTAVGTRIVSNSLAASTVSASSTAVGTRVVSGAADSTVAASSTAVGAIVYPGTADNVITVTSTAVGTVVVPGVADSAITVTSTAVGSTGGATVPGVADSAVTATSTAVGTRVTGGAAASTVTVTSSALGQNIPNYPAAGALVETIREDWRSGSINAFWGDVSAGTSVASERAEIAFTNAERYIGTLDQFILTGSRMHTEVVGVGSGGSRTVSLLAWLNASNSASIRYVDGNLSARYKQGGTDTNSGDVTYSATDHRWWRLRHDGSTLHFETSADGASWANPWSHTVSTNSWTDTVSPYLDIIGSGSPTGSAVFDNFNTPSVGAATVSGAASSATSVTSAAVGTRAVYGQTSFALTVASTAVGGRVVDGQAASTVTVTSTATGVAEIAGQAVSSLTPTSVAVGTKDVLGVAGSAVTVTSTADGTIGGAPVTGVADSTVTVASTAVGTRVVAGQADSTTTVTGTAAGTGLVFGTTEVTVTVSSTATGTRIVSGVAVSAATVSSTAAGTRIVLGVAVSAVTVTSTADGTVVAEVVTGVAVSTVTVSSTAVGTRVISGVASSTVTIDSTAVGAGAVTAVALVAHADLLRAFAAHDDLLRAFAAHDDLRREFSAYDEILK